MQFIFLRILYIYFRNPERYFSICPFLFGRICSINLFSVQFKCHIPIFRFCTIKRYCTAVKLNACSVELNRVGGTFFIGTRKSEIVVHSILYIFDPALMLRFRRIGELRCSVV